MSELGWMGLGILAWLVVGLVSIRIAAWLGHIWGFHLRDPLLGRAAIILQAPALILECAVMDRHYPDEDAPLAVGAARLMVAKFREPRADFEVLLEKLDRRSASLWQGTDVHAPMNTNVTMMIVPAHAATEVLNARG